LAIKAFRIALMAFLFISLVSVSVQEPVKAQSSAVLDAAIVQDLQLVVPNFGIVSAALLRGGQPNLSRLESLKRAGVKTIVDLRDGQHDIDTERECAEKLGLKFVSIPLSVFKTVSKDKVEKFLSTVRNPENQPVFVHCRQGQDRCGTMVAMYRTLEQSWTIDKAYVEMLKYGFHPMFVGLSASVAAMQSMQQAKQKTATLVN